MTSPAERKRARVLRFVAIGIVLAFLGATFAGAIGATSASVSPDPGAVGLPFGEPSMPLR